MSKAESLFRMTVSGVCGLLSPLISLTMIFVAISLSPWFNWTENALSDLGVSGLASIVFNSSLIIAGILAVVFAFGLVKILPNRVPVKVGIGVLVLSATSLCCIGFFPETTRIIHYFFSLAFFILLGLSMLIIGLTTIVYSPRKPLGWFALLIGIWAFAPWIFEWNGVAIPEFISALAGSTWAIVMSIRMLRNRRLVTKL